MDPTQIGRYRIVARIGQGAMGVVYKAEDAALGRFVAIKTISAGLLSDPRYHERFQREARSAAQLNHPNIVTVFEFAETGGQTYLVMELLQGADLRELIARRRVGGLDHRLAVVEQVLDGLAFAHARGIVHRDLKPANIHVAPDGTAKLLDFGLARLGLSEMTRTGTVMGTPNYMSPEQIRAEPVDGRSDLFSAGAILYELLAGRKAFDAENMHATLFEVLERHPPPLAEVVPGMPAEVVAIVEKALAKARDERYASAGEMGEAVRQARRGLATAQTVVLSFADGQQPGESPETVAAQPGDGSLSSSSTVPSPTLPTAAFTPTVLRGTSRAHPPVFGSNAPSLESAEGESVLESTARPERTAEPSSVQRSAPTGRRRLRAIQVAVGVVVLLGLARLLSRPGAPVAPGAATREQEAILRAAVVATRVELARADLQNKDYAEAARQAEGALALEPSNSEARAIATTVRETLLTLDTTAREAKAALERGDVATASRALGRVLAIDTHHPLAAELSAGLNRHFKLQAGQARRAVEIARVQAERAGAADTASFRAAARLVDEAEPMFGRGAYADATRKLVEASDGFGRARRSAETAAAEAAAARAAARVPALSLPAPPERTPAPSSPGPTAPDTALRSLNPLPGVPFAAKELHEASTSQGPTQPPAVTPPPSTLSAGAQPGSLKVTAKPWADVSIDDVKRGRTPLNSVLLTPGRHAVVLVHPDYLPLRRLLTIKSGELATLNIDMRDEALRKR